MFQANQSFWPIAKKSLFHAKHYFKKLHGVKVLLFMNMNSNNVNVSVQKFGDGLFNKDRPLTLRGNVTNASFEQ